MLRYLSYVNWSVVCGKKKMQLIALLILLKQQSPRCTSGFDAGCNEGLEG